MTISKGIKEKISALSDGELSDFETRRVLDEINIVIINKIVSNFLLK